MIKYRILAQQDISVLNKGDRYATYQGDGEYNNPITFDGDPGDYSMLKVGKPIEVEAGGFFHEAVVVPNDPQS